MAFAAKPNILRAELVLAICFALLPYFGGFLVIGTRNIGSLALAGALICVLCTFAAYLVRRQRDPVAAKYRLIVDPILYSFEFAFTAIVIRYLFGCFASDWPLGLESHPGLFQRESAFA